MTQPSYAPPPPPAPPPSALPPVVRWIGLGCGAFLLLAAVASSLFFLVLKKATAAPEQTVQGFLAAAGSGDFEKAHGYFSEALKEKQPLAEFADLAAKHQQAFQVQDTTFNSRSVDLKGAEFSGSVTLTSGDQLPASFKLVKEKGEWRLISYQLGS